MFYSTMWGNCGGFGRSFGPEVMWPAYFNRFLPVDLEGMPEDADADQHVGMRPSLSSPPLNTPLPAKGPLLTSSEGSRTEELPLTNGSSEDRPPRINGVPPAPPAKKNPEDEKIKEYLLRTDTAVIYPEPVGGTSPKQGEEKHRSSPEPSPIIEEPKVPNEYLLKCPHCDQVFSGQQAIRELQEHLSVCHKKSNTPEPNFTCQKCNTSFSTKENLSKHKLVHVPNGQGSTVTTDEKERKFKCTECGKAFKFKHHLKEHVRIHSGEKPFACPNCGKRFSHSGSYSSHMTSKKCLVVNLKVRKVDSRSPRGRGSTQNNSFRPIIPKYGSTGAGGSNASSAVPPDMPLIPAGYMPSSERFSSFTSRPQQSYLPLSFPHPMHYLPLNPFPEVTHLLQQRRYENEAELHSQLPPRLLPPPSSLKADDSPHSSPKPQELQKILAIVDNTVNKQQQSPTRPKNGLLSELLSSAPQPHLKSPPPPFSASADNRCRFCSRLFDGILELHHHERYICSSNVELRTRPELPDSPQLPRENGSEGESCEESNRYCTSPSALSVDSVLTLKAHYQINPRPKKSEIIRLARDLKCSVRTVHEWFQRQHQRSKDYPLNGNTSHSPTPPHQSAIPFSPAVVSDGHPFVPHYNGAISSCPPLMPFRPIPESPRLSSSGMDEEQPLDLSFKVKKEEANLLTQDKPRESHSPIESEVLNLSQRSSRTPPKESNPYSIQNNRVNHMQLQGQHNNSTEESSAQNSMNSIHSSLLYKYMQMGISANHVVEDREKSPIVEMPSSPDRSPDQTDHPQSVCSPGGASYADNSSSPSGTTGSYYQTDEPADNSLYSPTSAKKPRLWNQGEGDESTLEDSHGPEEDSSGGSLKMRKSWKLHKVESEEGMYACDQCDKMFNKQSSLARHKYEHSGQRPHKCDVCNKAFKHKHHLTEHKRLHSGEKPFQCKKCLKRFSHSGSYSQHMNHRFSYCKPFHE